MYEEIKKQIEQRIGKQPRHSVKTIAASGTYGERDTSLIAAHVSSELGRHMREMYDDKDAAEASAQPASTIREFGGLQTRRQLEKHFVERLSLDILGPMKVLDFTVPSGSRVLGPPYDLDWSHGNGMAIFSRMDGNVFTIPKVNDFSAAAIGFYLTTDEPALVAITPQGTYDFNWVSTKDLPFSRSSGGMGITIYTNSEPQPTLSRKPVLWSESGMTMLSSQKGSGQIADAAPPAFGFGTQPLAPALLDMVPGSRYLVWVWCWQTSQLDEDSGFWAFLGFSMPFVTIHAGPPILLH